MTDRVRYLTVILDKDYRDDDAEEISNAITMIRGVKEVSLGEPLSPYDYINRQVVGVEMYAKVVDAVREIVFPTKDAK